MARLLCQEPTKAFLETVAQTRVPRSQNETDRLGLGHSGPFAHWEMASDLVWWLCKNPLDTQSSDLGCGKWAQCGKMVRDSKGLRLLPLKAAAASPTFSLCLLALPC